jgi:hypothetical protein
VHGSCLDTGPDARIASGGLLQESHLTVNAQHLGHLLGKVGWRR